MLKQTIAASLAAIVVLSVSAQDWPNVIYHEQQARAEKAKPVNAARIAAEMKSAGLSNAKVTWYAVPAMSDVMRLADTFPEDGTFQGEVRAALALGEFEPASFELYSTADIKNATLKVGDLTGPDGTKIGGKDLDLRVVKIWFQNGNAWISYFDDPGLKLVPELMLHDENMVKVDLKGEANYARLKDGAKEKFVWISAPKEYGPAAFDQTSAQFRDADTLQPFQLNKGEFKQFILTVHAPKNQKPGVYRGVVEASAGGERLAAIPVAVRVLPFELPFPRTFRELDRAFVVSMMGAGARADKTLLQNYFDHGLFHPGIPSDNKDETRKIVAMMREIGFPLDWVFSRPGIGWFALNFGGRLSFDKIVEARRGAQWCVDFWDEMVGHHNVLTSYGDEQGAAFVVAQREFFEFYFEKGIKLGCAGHDALYNKGGYVYENMPLGTRPDDKERIDKWNQIGGKYLSFYACQHTGSENPQFVRYQHGLLGYFAGLSMVNNYEFATGSMNDRSKSVYRPMVITYRSGDGLMETLAWSGFREGIDDIRYATCLKLLAAEAREKGDGQAKLLANRALQYMAMLPRDMDLGAVRAEMTEYILKLRKALGK